MRGDHRQCWLCAALVMAASCSFDRTVPEATTVPCSEAAPQCPADWVCRTAVGKCVPRNATASVARIADATLTPALATRGTTLRLSFTTSTALLQPPVAVLVSGAQRRPFVVDTSASEPTSNTWSLHYAIGADDEEGLHEALVDATSADGVKTEAEPVGRVLFDFTPPSLTQAAITYLPPNDAPVAVASSLGTGVATVDVGANEPLADAGLAGPAWLDISTRAAPTFGRQFSVTATSGVPAGRAASERLSVWLVDAAGNASLTPLPVPLEARFEAPRPLDVIARWSPDGVEAPGNGELIVSGRVDEPDSGRTLVQALARDTDGGLPLTSWGPVSSDGAFSVRVPVRSRPAGQNDLGFNLLDVGVVLVDSAGNTSTPVLASAAQYLSRAGGSSGSLEDVGGFAQRRRVPGLDSVGPGTFDGRASWRRLSDPLPESYTYVYDSERAQVVGFARYFGSVLGSSTWSGKGWTGADLPAALQTEAGIVYDEETDTLLAYESNPYPTILEHAGDTWTPHPAVGLPPDAGVLRTAVDEVAGVLFFASNGDAWRWQANRFSRAGRGPPVTVLAYSPRERAPFAAVTGSLARFSDGGWQATPTRLPDAGPTRALAYDDEGRRWLALTSRGQTLTMHAASDDGGAFSALDTFDGGSTLFFRHGAFDIGRREFVMNVCPGTSFCQAAALPLVFSTRFELRPSPVPPLAFPASTRTPDGGWLLTDRSNGARLFDGVDFIDAGAGCSPSGGRYGPMLAWVPDANFAVCATQERSQVGFEDGGGFTWADIGVPPGFPESPVTGVVDGELWAVGGFSGGYVVADASVPLTALRTGWRFDATGRQWVSMGTTLSRSLDDGWLWPTPAALYAWTTGASELLRDGGSADAGVILVPTRAAFADCPRLGTRLLLGTLGPEVFRLSPGATGSTQLPLADPEGDGDAPAQFGPALWCDEQRGELQAVGATTTYRGVRGLNERWALVGANQATAQYSVPLPRTLVSGQSSFVVELEADIGGTGRGAVTGAELSMWVRGQWRRLASTLAPATAPASISAQWPFTLDDLGPAQELDVRISSVGLNEPFVRPATVTVRSLTVRVISRRESP